MVAARLPAAGICRTCNRTVAFARTADGTRLELDPAPTPAGNIAIEHGIAHRGASPRHRYIEHAVICTG